MAFLIQPELPNILNSHISQGGVELEVLEKMALIEWFANNYKQFGATLEIITDKSQEGSQFCRGFGGVGGMLFIKLGGGGGGEVLGKVGKFSVMTGLT